MLRLYSEKQKNDFGEDIYEFRGAITKCSGSFACTVSLCGSHWSDRLLHHFLFRACRKKAPRKRSA